MNKLSEIIKQQIATSGPISVADYFSICLGHPKHGYYMTRDPFGVKGDFTTAPEISQMFGELIGLWLAQGWLDRGSPKTCHLIECGPGRGTFMGDILRAGKMAPGFIDSLSIHLVETSPALTTLQKETLRGSNVEWHKDLTSLPEVDENQPNFIIANELFDALPIYQLVKTADGWRDKVIDLDENTDVFQWAYGKHASKLEGYLSQQVKEAAQENDIAECSPLSLTFAELLGQRIDASNGLGLIIDYGYEKSATGDSLQAMKNHKYCDVLDHCGEADLTAHVDFQSLAAKFMLANCIAAPLLTQGVFLERLGIGGRAAQLCQNATEKQKQDIQTALKRLTHRDEMGILFKVLAIRAADAPKLAGFEVE